MFQCQNESCLSHKTNLAFPKKEKSRTFAINPASVLGFRAIGGSHAAAAKVFSFLSLSPTNKNSWADHTKKIEQEAKLLLEDNLNRAARDVKEFKFSNGEIGVDSKIPLLTLVSQSMPHGAHEDGQPQMLLLQQSLQTLGRL